MSKNIVKEIAIKWYNRLVFPKEFDEMFERLLEETEDLPAMHYEEYDRKKNVAFSGKNLIMFLYFCEELEERYQKAGIDQEILLQTIEDVRVNVQRNVILKGKIGLLGGDFMQSRMSMKLFRLGRLQFEMSEMYVDIPQKKICKGEPILDVHIPKGGPLTPDECRQSFEMARSFFATYFPEYQYRCYTCFSWLLDDNLRSFLPNNSNILQFQKLFEVVHSRKENSILHFMFKFGLIEREEIRDCPATTDFAKKIKEYALAGGVFYNVLGVREREEEWRPWRGR